MKNTFFIVVIIIAAFALSTLPFGCGDDDDDNNVSDDDDTTDDDADVVLALQGLDGGLQQPGLAAAGGGHQVDGQHTVGLKVFPIMGGLVVVICQQVFHD